MRRTAKYRYKSLASSYVCERLVRSSCSTRAPCALGRGRGALGLLEHPHKRPSLRHDNGPFPSRSELFNDAALHRSRREDVVLGCERFRVPLTIDASLFCDNLIHRTPGRRPHECEPQFVNGPMLVEHEYEVVVRPELVSSTISAKP